MNPVAFNLWGFEIRWYGIFIAAAIAAAIFISHKRATAHEIDTNDFLDVILLAIPMGLLGARAYYVIFNWNLYRNDFSSALNLRNGGLAIHGALILGGIGVLIMCRIKKINPLNLFDLIAPSVALAQSIGRWGNFTNGEAHGGPTSLPWAIEVDGQMVHPTFFYESIWCLLLFFLLKYIDRKQNFKGRIFLLYIILYSLERFFVEWLRTDSLMLGPLKTAQVVSLTAIILSVIFYRLLSSKYHKTN